MATDSPVRPVQIPLRDRDGRLRAYALVDAEDARTVSAHRWCTTTIHGHDRVHRKAGERSIYLARELLGLRHGDRRQADHKNGNALDNRRENLRIVTHAENQQNQRGAHRDSRSGVRGVTWDRARGRWAARAQINGRQYNLGRFATLEEAAAVVTAFRRDHMPHSEMDQSANGAGQWVCKG